MTTPTPTSHCEGDANLLKQLHRQVTTLAKWGNSLGVRIPKAELERYNFEQGEKLKVTVEQDKIILEKLPIARRYKFQDIQQRFQTAEQEPEMDWGDPVGREQL